MRKPRTLLVIAILAAAQVAMWVAGSSGSGRSVRISGAGIPTRFGDWQASDLGPLDDLSLEMLQPDAAVWRSYRNAAGGEAELLVIYGHRKATFHSPGQCLLGEGWNIVSKRKVRAALAGRERTINRFLIQNGENRAVVLYAYAQGGRVTPSWVKHQFYLAAARARGRPGTGALVRVIVPATRSEAAADATGLRLMGAALPSVLGSLQAAG